MANKVQMNRQIRETQTQEGHLNLIQGVHLNQVDQMVPQNLGMAKVKVEKMSPQVSKI